MDVPETRYAKRDGVHIAYQVVGDGPVDIVWCEDVPFSVDAVWHQPRIARCLQRLGAFCRLLLFDARGSGASDTVNFDAPLTLEVLAEDVEIVMDAAGSDRAAIFGHDTAARTAVLFAATRPSRTSALVMVDGLARNYIAEDYPYGLPAELRVALRDFTDDGWGTTPFNRSPSVIGDREIQRWILWAQRLYASPGTAMAMGDVWNEVDVRDVLPSIHVPTLVMYRRDRARFEQHANYLGEHIVNAKVVPIPGADGSLYWEHVDEWMDELQEFVTGARPVHEVDRVLATVLFTDIVGSTEKASELGDRRWKQLLADHDDAVGRELQRFRGTAIDHTGDGLLATFDGPARAVRCAQAMHAAVGRLGLQIRAGVHTGEVELDGGNVRGIAVHVGARVSSLAEAGEVLVSSTVKDLVAGSGLEFDDRGHHTLKGVPDDVRIYAVRS